mmetsp:Transcript_16580/g.33371  ORF Transcript_16580/g.33371 Transcript_16580/m.33371 type:complete len:204 (+) Transcript_16580:477-1088(+)
MAAWERLLSVALRAARAASSLKPISQSAVTLSSAGSGRPGRFEGSSSYCCITASCKASWAVPSQSSATALSISFSLRRSASAASGSAYPRPTRRSKAPTSIADPRSVLPSWATERSLRRCSLRTRSAASLSSAYAAARCTSLLHASSAALATRWERPRASKSAILTSSSGPRVSSQRSPSARWSIEEASLRSPLCRARAPCRK